AQAKDKDAALAAHTQITNSCMSCHREHRAMGPGGRGGMGGGPPGFGPPGGGRPGPGGPPPSPGGPPPGPGGPPPGPGGPPPGRGGEVPKSRHAGGGADLSRPRPGRPPYRVDFGVEPPGRNPGRGSASGGQTTFRGAV